MLITKTEIPPSGWNSFDCYLTTINEEQTLANLEQFLRKLKPAGYEYFCLDAAWYADGDAELDEDLRRVGQNRKMHIDEFGRFIPSPINFPHGLRPIAAMKTASSSAFISCGECPVSPWNGTPP